MKDKGRRDYTLNPTPRGPTNGVQFTDAYPITTFTWILFYRNLNKPDVTAALQKMVEWGITDGQKMADALGYVPLPEVVVKRVRAEIPNIQ